MYLNENIRKIAKIFILVFLCSEMQSSVTQNNTYEERVLHYRHDLNASEATTGTSQHHASIRLREKDQRFGEGHMCSGAIIGPSVVLTTAQCVYNYNKNKAYHPSELKVVLGSIARYQRSDDALIYSVTHNYQPKTFNAQNLRDNLAILMLERDIPEISESVQPITMYQNKLHNTNWYDKDNVGQYRVTTWLKTNEGLAVNHLMLLNASKLSEETCVNYYGSAVFSTGMLCMRLTETLLEDPGSPLFIDNKLVGLMSYATGNLSPAVYTDISYHAKWIQDKIGNGTNQNGSIWGMLGFLLLTFVALKRSKFMKL